jgi:glycosyltransferase involved in cell wall biosynthesis
MTDKRLPLLSVVVSTMNARAHLQECLDSVFTQTDPRWEVIVIDGGSCDGTKTVIQENVSRLKYWLSEPDTGVYDAWNKALPHVSGHWVMFLGADDRLWDEKVLSAVSPALSAASSRIAYGRVALTDEQGLVVREEGQAWVRVAARFRNEMCIPHQGVFHRADIFRNKRFDASFRYAGDYMLLLEEVFREPPLFPDTRVSTWRQGGLTSSAGQSIKVLREFRVARAKAGIGGRAPLWTEYKAWGKYALERILGRNESARLLNAYRRRRRA